VNIVGWSNTVAEPAFGGGSTGADASIKSRIINLMTSVRTLMRSKLPLVCMDGERELWLRKEKGER
jgi:hypothetical protein